MSDTQDLLARQAKWQKSRKALPWSEKIRLAEGVRESVLRLRGAGQLTAPGPARSNPRRREVEPVPELPAAASGGGG